MWCRVYEIIDSETTIGEAFPRKTVGCFILECWREMEGQVGNCMDRF